MKNRADTNVEMICSVSELANLFRQGQDLRGFLSQVVRILSGHMQCQVCSVFLYNENSDRLVLEATVGLNENQIGILSLAPGEGLTGMALQELRPIREGRGQDNPHFKFFPESGEEPFESFLAVPIIRGIHRVGVLVLQDEKRSRFKKADAMALKAIASQLAATLENAQLLMRFSKNVPSREQRKISSKIIRGIGVMEGIGLGRAYVIESSRNNDNRLIAGYDNYMETIEAFRNSISQTENQLESLQRKLEVELSDVASLIFSAHLLMLRDQGFSGAMEQLILDGTAPSKAIEQITNNYISVFAASDNPRLREKILDVKDLGHRLLKNLVDGNRDHGDYSGQIVITNELLPSEFLKLSAQNVEGIVLFGGGATAHVAVLARSLHVPLIYTENESIFSIPENTDLALDAFQALLLVDPDENAQEKFRRLKEDLVDPAALEMSVDPETHTQDGRRIFLRATINLLSDIRLARRLKAEGIGLYRSEFPFLIRNDFPSEEEQYRIYRQVLDDMDSSVVTLRTLDVGGDKILSYLPDAKEANPFLGLRAIRFLLENKKVFVGQLKAMIRAGGKREIRILFPLVSSVEDFLNARRMVVKSLSFLERDGLGQFPLPRLGAMIELPSAVEMADELAKEADFLSLGSNDLVQYMLGVDRTNEKVASRFDYHHPAVLRAVKRVVDAAKAADCPLSICGIMSSDPASVYYLTGLGVQEFSMEPGKIPGIQERISRLNFGEAERHAQEIAKLATLNEIQNYMKDFKILD